MLAISWSPHRDRDPKIAACGRKPSYKFGRIKYPTRLNFVTLAGLTNRGGLFQFSQLVGIVRKKKTSPKMLIGLDLR